MHYAGAYVLIGAAVAGVILGVLWMLRRRALGPLLLLVGNGVPTAVLLTRSGPYAASKELMILSTSVVLTAMVGAAALADIGARDGVVSRAGGGPDTESRAGRRNGTASRGGRGNGTASRAGRREPGRLLASWLNAPMPTGRWVKRGCRATGWALAGAIAAGVLWTNVLAYHDSSVAPQPRFRELAAIGARFHGRGPAFFDLWDTYPVYFLREESVSVPDTFAGPVPERPGLPPHSMGQLSTPWDPNDLDFSFLQSFRLLILGRSPLVSRPPANYQLAYQGRYYEVFERTSTPVVLRHLPISDGTVDPPSPPSCRVVIATAASAAAAHARLAYVARPSLPTLVPTRATYPPAWSPTAASGRGPADILSMGQSPGVLLGKLRVPASARYQVWLEGSLSRHLIVTIGGRTVGAIRHQIGPAGQFSPVGTVYLRADNQTVQILRPPSRYAPGNVPSDLLGSLVLVPSNLPPSVRVLAPSAARSLCGKPLEWLEIVR